LFAAAAGRQYQKRKQKRCSQAQDAAAAQVKLGHGNLFLVNCIATFLLLPGIAES
jgi:hypothetical protein